MESAVLRRLRTMTRSWDAVNDRRAIFADAYGRMTEAMLVAIAQHTFSDGVWVHRLLERFADYYFLATEAWEAGAGCPDVWCDVFAATGRPDVNAFQALFLGVNAHINHDLVYALVDVLEDWESLDAGLRLDRERDHSTVNVVIAGTIDVVQDQVIGTRAPEFGLLDSLLGQVDEWAFSRLIAGWRAHVWDDAQRLMAASPAERYAIDADVCERTRSIARLVASV